MIAFQLQCVYLCCDACQKPLSYGQRVIKFSSIQQYIVLEVCLIAWLLSDIFTTLIVIRCLLIVKKQQTHMYKRKLSH